MTFVVPSFNLSDIINQTFVIAFNPYVSIFGNLTWGIIFGFMGGAIYAGSERQYLLTFGYLVIVGITFGIILPYALIAIFGIIVAFIGTVVVYNAFVASD